MSNQAEEDKLNITGSLYSHIEEMRSIIKHNMKEPHHPDTQGASLLNELEGVKQLVNGIRLKDMKSYEQ